MPPVTITSPAANVIGSAAVGVGVEIGVGSIGAGVGVSVGIGEGVGVGSGSLAKLRLNPDLIIGTPLGRYVSVSIAGSPSRKNRIVWLLKVPSTGATVRLKYSPSETSTGSLRYVPISA